MQNYLSLIVYAICAKSQLLFVVELRLQPVTIRPCNQSCIIVCHFGGQTSVPVIYRLIIAKRQNQCKIRCIWIGQIQGRKQLNFSTIQLRDDCFIISFNSFLTERIAPSIKLWQNSLPLALNCSGIRKKFSSSYSICSH